eukprot:TRINITY_DN20586_c0_g1_i1.p1 TRINITY_DN20586_c0_g1~~TRINITY_DN20586_c0_g1_i1.p1  ORF type:complete len:285 (+),score=25.62 TRINITY_DN20586_c0_g1_i1:68-856(+)
MASASRPSSLLPAGLSSSNSTLRERERQELSSIWGASRSSAPRRPITVKPSPADYLPPDSDRPRKTPGKRPGASGEESDDVAAGEDSADSDSGVRSSKNRAVPGAKVAVRRREVLTTVRDATLVLPVPADKDRLDVLRALVDHPPKTVKVAAHQSSGGRHAMVVYETREEADAAVAALNGKISASLGVQLDLSFRRSRREQANLRWRRSLARRGMDAKAIKKRERSVVAASRARVDGDGDGELVGVAKRARRIEGGLHGIVS